MIQKSEKIVLKQCPICNNPILKTQRFMNHVKGLIEDIKRIKQEQIKKLNIIKWSQNKILYSLKELDDTFYLILVKDKKQNGNVKYLWSSFCKPLLASLKEQKKIKIALSANNINSLDFVQICS